MRVAFGTNQFVRGLHLILVMINFNRLNAGYAYLAFSCSFQFYIWRQSTKIRRSQKNCWQGCVSASCFSAVLLLSPIAYLSLSPWKKGAMRTMLLSSLFLLSSFSTTFSSPVDERAVCGDFVEGACDLSEYNIIEHNRYTDTPKECQV